MVRGNTLMILLVSWFVVLGYHMIIGKKLTMEEDKILETQLKYLNKHAVTTIQTKYGETYDCVDFYQQPAFDHPLLKDHKYEFKIAVLRTTEGKKYYGGAMTSSVYHPAVQSRQYSSSRMVVQNGIDSIAVGWTTKDLHCYNTYCPGFVITSSQFPLDLLLKPYTVIGDTTYASHVYISKEATSGDWILMIRNENIRMGYWPQKIFTNLADSANYIEWGGEVYSPHGIIPPPMGSGQLPTDDPFYNCYARGITLINEYHELEHNPSACITYHTTERYNIIDTFIIPDYDRVIFYGGH
ncbi:hypothetical protein LINGRAHAP2_LOCUS11672 [Linum grandiflorum]